jgi:hypothetical protein
LRTAAITFFFHTAAESCFLLFFNIEEVLSLSFTILISSGTFAFISWDHTFVSYFLSQIKISTNGSSYNISSGGGRWLKAVDEMFLGL